MVVTGSSSIKGIVELNALAVFTCDFNWIEYAKPVASVNECRWQSMLKMFALFDTLDKCLAIKLSHVAAQSSCASRNLTHVY